MNSIKQRAPKLVAILSLFICSAALAQSDLNDAENATEKSEASPASATDIIKKQWPLGAQFRVDDVSGNGNTFCSFQKGHVVAMTLNAGGDLSVDPIDPSQAKVPVYSEEGQVGNRTGTTLYMQQVTKRHVPRDVDWDTRDYTLNSKVSEDTIINEIANKNFLVFRKWGTKTVLKKNGDGSISVSVDRKIIDPGNATNFKETCRLVPIK